MRLFEWWTRLSLFQQAAAVSTLVLTVGAIKEYWSALKYIPRLLWRVILLRSNEFERCTLRKLLLHSVAPRMVVAGIGGELIFETADFIEENRKSAESDSNVRIARKEAADGLKDAAKRLDEAKKEEDAARLALQSQIVVQGPRAPLIERNRSDLIRRLKVFSGQRCFIVTAAGSEANKNEIHNTLGIIEFILRSPEGAGWTLEFVNDETSNVPGIVVYVNSIAETRTSESARALSAALAGEFPKECWCREATPSESNVTHGHG